MMEQAEAVLAAKRAIVLMIKAHSLLAKAADKLEDISSDEETMSIIHDIDNWIMSAKNWPNPKSSESEMLNALREIAGYSERNGMTRTKMRKIALSTLNKVSIFISDGEV